MDNLPIETHLYLFDIEDTDKGDEDFLSELARRSIGKYENTVKLLQYNNHIIHVNNIDNFFRCFRCSTCDIFFHKADHFI